MQIYFYREERDYMRNLAFRKRIVAVMLAVIAVVTSSGTIYAHDQNQYQQKSWKFGIMADTQWKTSPDGKNPNNVAASVISRLNQEFIKQGVKFVFQVGDLTENGNNLEMDTTATFRQALYNAGIGFYPLRGNHETSAAVADEFRRVFPQTRTGMNNQTPADALVTTAYYGAPPANTNSAFMAGSNFSSPVDIDPNYAGLTYAFDYNNARFLLLDIFTVPNIACNLIESQQPWISKTLAARKTGTHAFVLSHKGLITENHKDILFTEPGKCNGSSTNSTPAVKPAEQNVFLSSLFNNGVRLYINGHDHMHNRAIVESPDRTSVVQNITASSNSYKFYIPLVPSNDETYDLPAFGFQRETLLAQELFTVGYYIVTVDGPRVTVDYYSSPNGCNGDCDQTNDVIPYTFTKRESFGYSLNGKDFLVPQGASYASVRDHHNGTNAAVLGGMNNSAIKAYDGRSMSKIVSIGWSPKAHDMKNEIFTLWGMAGVLGSDQTDVFALSLSYDHADVDHKELKRGHFGLVVKDTSGNWTNAVEKNYGGMKKFVYGPWQADYELGTYGVDPHTHTVWAVINYNGDFSSAEFHAAHHKDHE